MVNVDGFHPKLGGSKVFRYGHLLLLVVNCLVAIYVASPGGEKQERWRAYSPSSRWDFTTSSDERQEDLIVAIICLCPRASQRPWRLRDHGLLSFKARVLSELALPLGSMTSFLWINWHLSVMTMISW